MATHRDALSSVIDLQVFSAFRRFVMWQEALVEDEFVKNVARKNGVPVLDSVELSKRLENKSRDCFYVLGSGSSVESLTREDFESISRGVSVGINAWAIHDFVPDMYSFEPVPFRDSDHFQTMDLLDRQEVADKVRAILFLKPRTPVESEQLERVPNALTDRVMLYGRFQPFTRREENLVADFRIVRLLRARNKSILLDSGASIIRMAFLAAILGYRRIVFVGVDLNHTEYFWEKNEVYLKNRGLSHFASGQTGESHETLSNINRAFGVMNMVKAMKKYFGTEGVELEVANPQSLLAEILPVHVFNSS